MLFGGILHREDPFPFLFSDPLFLYFVLKALLDSSRFRLGRGASGGP